MGKPESCIKLMQLMETPRMALCFEISEKYFCLSFCRCTEARSHGGPLIPALLTLRGPVMPFRSSADLTQAGSRAQLKIGCKKPAPRDYMEGEQVSNGSLGRPCRAGAGGTGHRAQEKG